MRFSFAAMISILQLGISPLPATGKRTGSLRRRSTAVNKILKLMVKCRLESAPKEDGVYWEHYWNRVLIGSFSPQKPPVENDLTAQVAGQIVVPGDTFEVTVPYN